jgi:hypothetical protein
MWPFVAANHYIPGPTRRSLAQNTSLKMIYRNTRQSEHIENQVHTIEKRLLKTRNSTTRFLKRMSTNEKSLSKNNKSMTTNQNRVTAIQISM